MFYSTERGAWQLFIDGEWYAEGNYELLRDMAILFELPPLFDDEEEIYDE